MPLPPHLRIEQTTQPWFGPRARAKSVLAANRTAVMPPPDAAELVTRTIDGGIDGITGLRFIDYFHRSERFRYTIALVWTQADWRLRQEIYDSAERVARDTGWYPLVQGERLDSARRRRVAWRNLHGTSELPLVEGDLVSVRALVPPDDGCSIWVSTTSGGIVLDTGFPQALQRRELQDVRLTFVSHSHQDHAGGLLRGAKWETPTVCTLETAVLLFGGSRASELPPGLRPLDVDRTHNLGSIELELMPVPHLPGAAAIQLTSPTATLVFTGDICLRSPHLDFVPILAERLASKKRPRTMLLLDATMAGRDGGASTRAIADGVIDLLDQHGDLVLTAEGAEHLLYAYLDLFTRVNSSARRGSINFVLTRAMRPLFEVIHDAYMHRDFHRLDPYVQAHYGKTMSAWGESRWLYWSDGEALAPPRTQTLWFFPHRQIAALPPHCKAMINIGRSPRNDRTEGEGSYLKLDTSPWTLHSDETAIVEAMRQLSQYGRVALFHNYPGRLRSFIRRHGILATALTSEALAI